MRAHRRFQFLALVAVVFVSAVLPATAIAAEQPVRKIVVFESRQVNQRALARIERLGAVKLKELPLIGGAAVVLPGKAAEKAVSAMPEVARVDEDIILTATKRPAPVPPAPPAQTVPWGIARVGAPSAWIVSIGDPVKLAIIDTGIDITHPDLAANVKGGFNAISTRKSYADDNGHGTHVAGTAGALDNTIGVVGIAPAVDLYSVKVLDRTGTGYLSDIIEGLQWAAANDMDVANMSLGTSVYSQSLADAVKATYASGVVIVASAGNDGPGTDTVGYPAKLPEAIAVGATTSTDALAYFSSTGPAVELSAPGYDIYSTYKGSVYATMSGTSMASPHVAGTAALVIATPVGAWDSDLDGAWDPAEVRAKLAATAQDLGAAGRDSSFGYGLVRADLAVQ